MSHQAELIETDILAYLKSQEHKSLLRFITCGSVDDGKSTLIGRLLYESKLIYEDQLAALEQDSKKVGTQGENIDFALLVDGLAAEREQGITIDVAYRYFSTDKRKFIVADTPGHEQYTRNMATGASTADLAILMIDARKGILTQTKRHSSIVQMLGVKKIVLAVNKMDLVNFSKDVFDSIVKDYHQFASQIGINDITAIPVSALEGDNITTESTKMDWYKGDTLMSFLESVEINDSSDHESFTMPVQWVNRPNLDFRGFAGQVSSGKVSVGEKIKVLPANIETTVKSIVTFDGELQTALKGQSITITFEDEVDASRGDILVSESSTAKIAHIFESKLLWMSEEPMVPGKQYWLKIRAKMVSATLKQPKYKIDVNTLEQQEAHDLALNEIGISDLIVDQDIAYEHYTDNKNLGSFILIDRLTNNTVGMGLIQHAIEQTSWVDRYVKQRDKYWVRSDISNKERSTQFGHKPLLLILTSQSENDYSHVAKQLEKELFQKQIKTYRYGFQYMGSALAGEASFNKEEMRQDMIKSLIEIAHAFCDSGQVFITAIHKLKESELNTIKRIMEPFECQVIGLDEQVKFADFNVDKNQTLDNAVIDLIKAKLIS